jgi:hypothetical protein
MMILIVEYTLALYSKNIELMVISMATPLFMQQYNIIFHIIPLIYSLHQIALFCPGVWTALFTTCQYHQYFLKTFF